MELGHEEPTVLLTNHGRLGPAELVTRYAQRLLIENGIAEAVQFFHIDALSSMVGMKVDFDLQLTLLASSLYRIMAQRIGREYRHSQAKTVFRHLLDVSGKVEITANSVIVTLDKRAHNPFWWPRVWPDRPIPMPVKHLLRTSAQGDEGDQFPVQFRKLLIGGYLGVKY
jgi:hypothetical protein